MAGQNARPIVGYGPRPVTSSHRLPEASQWHLARHRPIEQFLVTGRWLVTGYRPVNQLLSLAGDMWPVTGRWPMTEQWPVTCDQALAGDMWPGIGQSTSCCHWPVTCDQSLAGDPWPGSGRWHVTGHWPVTCGRALRSVQILVIQLVHIYAVLGTISCFMKQREAQNRMSQFTLFKTLRRAQPCALLLFWFAIWTPAFDAPTLSVHKRRQPLLRYGSHRGLVGLLKLCSGRSWRKRNIQFINILYLFTYLTHSHVECHPPLEHRRSH